MVRSVDEWIGKTDDERAPKRVRDRIIVQNPFCHLCGGAVMVGDKWDLDHVKALINGGENREGNLRPAHRKCHVEKTALDVAEKARIARIRQKHNGSARPSGKLRGAPFPKFSKDRKSIDKDAIPPLPRNQLFEKVTT